MKENINIAEILKNKPKGTKLYADAFGELSIEDIYAEGKDELGITLSSKDGDELLFYNDGKYNIYGEPILVPSKEMRDWEKFAWKRGDVLVNSRGLKILFDRWANDNYTSFYAKTINLAEDGFLDTNLHTLASEKEAKSFIKCIEEKLGGKLNREALEVEKTQPEFKDGDIVTAVFTDGDEMICVFKEKIEQDYMGYCGFFSKGKHEGDVSMDLGDDCICNDSPICKEIRLATEEEKQQLVSLLQDYLRNRLVYLSVEHIVSTVVVLHRSLLRKHPHRPNEGRLHLVVLLRIRLAPVLAPQHVEAVLFTPRKLQKLGV